MAECESGSGRGGQTAARRVGAGGIGRAIAGLLAAAVAAYWLFADTAAYYRSAGRAPNEIRFSYWG
ncbi:MAG: hypothetical protein AAB654_14205, partial [Acidobacteriota bacterium]